MGNPSTNCTITPPSMGAPGTCSVNSGAPAGTVCIGSTVGSTPSGTAGPMITVNVQGSPFTITPGSSGAAVQGLSGGSGGGSGGNTYVGGDAGNGYPGA